MTTTHGLASNRPYAAARDVSRGIPVVPEQILAAQLVMIAGLVLAYAIAKSMHVLGGHDQLLGLNFLFDLDEERNLPSTYSAVAILAAACLLVLTGGLYRMQAIRGAWSWFFLASVFLFLAVDESFSLHEKLALPIRDLLQNDRPGHLNWVLGGFTFLAVVAAFSLRFVFRLDRRPRWLMLGAGFLFVSGALGVEMLGGLRLQERVGSLANPDPIYFLAVAIEESLEMLGIALFNYALLDHLRARFDQVVFRFRGSPAERL